ncbi:hypothetical protein [Deinococcus aquatilis]|uniref:hypothetical protein n=1 Tax=Deinococcus aquatilis TaxID=519440 RepID=UPI00036F52B0|nr:hypothetical protein [Deinococcus aquatilis]
MHPELVFEMRQHTTVVQAESLHAALGIQTDLRIWIIMHTAAGQAEFGIDVFDSGSSLTACWSLAFAAEVAQLEHDPALAQRLLSGRRSLLA